MSTHPSCFPSSRSDICSSTNDKKKPRRKKRQFETPRGCLRLWSVQMLRSVTTSSACCELLSVAFLPFPGSLIQYRPSTVHRQLILSSASLVQAFRSRSSLFYSWLSTELNSIPASLYQVQKHAVLLSHMKTSNSVASRLPLWFAIFTAKAPQQFRICSPFIFINSVKFGLIHWPCGATYAHWLADGCFDILFSLACENFLINRTTLYVEQRLW